MSETQVFEIPAGVPTYAAIRDQLRADILSGKIPGGTRLTTASLVDRFGISQMPVREALQALEGERLIDIQPHKGACVLPLTERRVRNIYDLRGAIECLLFRLSVPNLTNAAMTRLTELHRQFAGLIERRDTEEIFRLNSEFHNLIYRHADNPEALESYDRFARLLGTLRTNFGFSMERMNRMFEEHDQLLDALREQDVERLEHLARLHVEGAKTDLLTRMGDNTSEHSTGN